MPDPIVKVLDTTIADTGPTQKMEFDFLKKDIPMRLAPSIGSGDTVVIEGKHEDADSFQTLATFTSNIPQDVYLSRFWRARRTVDGTTGDSWIKAQNLHNQELTGHV